MTFVLEIAQEIFKRDRFEYNLIDQAQAKIKALKARKLVKSKSKKAKAHDPDSDPIMEKVSSPKEYGNQKYRTNPPEDEVKGLIKKMSQMNLNDPEYSTNYYRAFCLDEHIAKVCAPSNVGHQLPIGNPPPPHNRFLPPIPPMPPRVNSSSLPSAPNSNPSTNPVPPPNMAPRPPMTCYGCGEQGHGIARCGLVAGLLNRREQGEYLVQSVWRITSQSTPITSNFVISMNPDCYISATHDLYDFEEDSTMESDPEEIEVLAVERNPKTVTMNCRDLE
ncbi:hypothetical protein BDN71DRAFT_1512759 [Pleurotus eryngii]|uniref:CCHC-type domain-containing protein n=1 Tax=Pleurotus eryngii TaxID=5323 RepID=A0A9P5ZKJ3_PLEER|nr:hypothetical protein BDN71DRAFT_1512759 [Pleurotus eryngii]